MVDPTTQQPIIEDAPDLTDYYTKVYIDYNLFTRAQTEELYVSKQVFATTLQPLVSVELLKYYTKVASDATFAKLADVKSKLQVMGFDWDTNVFTNSGNVTMQQLA